MGKSRTLATYVDEAGNRTTKPTASGPFVGIWWADKTTLAALLQPAANVRSKAPLIDSNFEHWRAWESVCKHFKKGSDEEYFVVPRGRVLLRRQDGTGVIYHGDATSTAMLKRIAKLFDLATYTTAVDGHYLMDSDAHFYD